MRGMITSGKSVKLELKRLDVGIDARVEPVIDRGVALNHGFL